MKTLEWYLGWLASSTSGVDVQGSLVYGLVVVAVASVVVAAIAGANR